MLGIIFSHRLHIFAPTKTQDINPLAKMTKFFLKNY